MEHVVDDICQPATAFIERVTVVPLSPLETTSGWLTAGCRRRILTAGMHDVVQPIQETVSAETQAVSLSS